MDPHEGAWGKVIKINGLYINFFCSMLRDDFSAHSLAFRRSTGLPKGLSFPAMAPFNRIVLDPAVVHGKPVIRGTRLPVTVVVGSLAGGMTFEEVQREYDLTADDIRAALKFVADLAEQESFHPLPAV
ncbi:MAG: DUF433 domain-containing protein [Steroidobacteraceae bacterium]